MPSKYAEVERAVDEADLEWEANLSLIIRRMTGPWSSEVACNGAERYTEEG